MPFAERKGNQVINGGFEQGLSSWLGVDNVGLATNGRQHQGLIAAAMGRENNSCSATMFQDVFAAPFRTYKLQFSISGFKPRPAALEVEVRYLDCVGVDLGSALGCCPLTVQPETIGCAGAGAYKNVIAITELAPQGTASARISFRKCPGCDDNYLLVDNVIFVGM